jgi:hypothetical protein
MELRYSNCDRDMIEELFETIAFQRDGEPRSVREMSVREMSVREMSLQTMGLKTAFDAAR